MIIYHDPQCSEYGSSQRPEQPARVIKSAAHLRAAHSGWEWRVPVLASEDVLRLAHSRRHLDRLVQPEDFDSDTPFFSGIYDHARRAVGAAVGATETALNSAQPAFALMRPPGHHATTDQAMGFCYLNSIAIAALYAQANLGAKRVAVWDFDAHHGNGTEAILRGRENIIFASVHQSPGYPGTGTASAGNCHNWPVAPRTPSLRHMAALRESLDTVLSFDPDLILVSAGFDAYRGDPITIMSLEKNDFEELGRWLRDAGKPAAAVLEGGYSEDLPLLIDAFLSAWNK
jgi:acetoin utilization deacetylase AcuC-like enzyme